MCVHVYDASEGMCVGGLLLCVCYRTLMFISFCKFPHRISDQAHMHNSNQIFGV